MQPGKRSFTNICLFVLLQNLELNNSEDGTYGYEIRSRFPRGILHEIRDSTLYITEKIFSLDRLLRMLEYLREPKRVGIVIHVPKDSNLDTVSLKNISGNTDIKEIRCQTLDIDTTSGKIAVAAGSAENFKARQTSGRLILENCAMKNSEIATTSGKVEINNTRTQGLKISATSGNAIVSGVPAGHTEIKTTSGGITLDIADKKQNFNANINVTSGKIYIDGQKQTGRKLTPLPQRENGGNGLHLKTTSGDVKLNFA